jgi:hypothetical protein
VALRSRALSHRQRRTTRSRPHRPCPRTSTFGRVPQVSVRSRIGQIRRIGQIGRIANQRRSPVLHRTIRDSLFAIRRSLFAVFDHSPLATRDSPSFPFAIRNSLFAVFFRSLLAARHSPSFSFAIRRARWAAGKVPAPQHNQGGSGTRPYLDQHLAAFAIAVVQPAGRSAAAPPRSAPARNRE